MFLNLLTDPALTPASGKVEGTIADSYMRPLLMEQQQQQQQEEEEEVLPSGVCLFDHIDDLVPVFPRENALDFSCAPLPFHDHIDDLVPVFPRENALDFSCAPLPFHPDDDKDGCLDHCFITIPSKDVETTTTSTYNHHHQLFEDLEWLSTFMDVEPFSFDLFPAHDLYFQTLSPVSVLEPNGVTAAASSSTCSSTTSSSGRRTVIPGRARSKRPRRAALRLRRSTNLPSPPEESAIPTTKFKIIKKSSSASIHVVGEVDQSGSARKCTHCQIQRTPQWRAGPMGPKTLCNACGVRYRSGRLFPEYRPAASPTFVSSLHSSSHKKVVEMRINNAATSRSYDLLDLIRLRPPTRED